MRLVIFAKLMPEERDVAWGKMEKNRRNFLVGEAMGKRVVAHSWPCRNYDDGPSPDFILPITYYHHLGVETRWPVYVPEDLLDADWPPKWIKDEEGRRRRCDLEPLPDFVGDMGAAYGIIKWLRATDPWFRGAFQAKLSHLIKLQFRDSIHLSLSEGEIFWCFLMQADWPVVLGRAVVEAAIARGEGQG